MQKVQLSPMTMFMLGLRGEEKPPVEEKTPEQLAQESADLQKSIDALAESNPALKQYFEQQKAVTDKAIADAVKTATETATAKALEEVEKKAKAEQRRKAKEDAEAAGNQEEVARLANEEIENNKAEALRLKNEAQAERNFATKVRIVTAAGLDESYANRLIGENAEQWKADAQLLAKDRVKPTKPDGEGGNRTVVTSQEDRGKAATKAASSAIGMF